MSQRIAIIAGGGEFPLHVAREAKRQGVTVIGIGIQGWVDSGLRTHTDRYEEIGIGELRRLIERLKAHQVHEAIMAGKVTKAVLLDHAASFDQELRGLVESAKDASVGMLLGAVARRLAQAGITLLDSSTFLTDSLCRVGVLTSRGPTTAEADDIRVGQEAARALATLDIGQTAVVKGRVVVAVEALEGTDAAIRRAHTIAGRGLVVVKVASPRQDRRFDLPVVGATTLTTLKDSGVSCLALEADATVLLDRETLLATADAAGICLVGIAIPASS